MIEIVCNNGGSSPNQELSSLDILNKLKEIHEKLKRLNKTYSDPKLGRITNNKTQLFLDKNTKKFLNMTSSLGLMSRKIAKSKHFETDNDIIFTTLGNKLRTTTSGSLKDLEDEIEKFFFSNEIKLTNEINEIEKNNNAFKSNTGNEIYFKN